MEPTDWNRMATLISMPPDPQRIPPAFRQQIRMRTDGEELELTALFIRAKEALAAMTRERDAWRKQLYECAYNRGVAEAKLEAVEAIAGEMRKHGRKQHWIYTRGEIIRRTCIEELETALKGE